MEHPLFDNLRDKTMETKKVKLRRRDPVLSYRDRIRQLLHLHLTYLFIQLQLIHLPLPPSTNTQPTMSTLQDPTNATRATPTIPAENATLHIGSSTLISAPSSKVWAALTDTSTWPTWNSFVPRVTIRSQPDTPAHQAPTDPEGPTQQQQAQAEPSTSTALSPILQKGTKMTFHVRMDPTSTKPQASRDVGLVVTEFQPPNPETRAAGRIVWAADYEAAGSMPRSLLAAERVHEVVDAEGGTEVRNWEAQAGWAVYAVKWLYGKKLQTLFEGWVDELRGFVEGVPGSA